MGRISAATALSAVFALSLAAGIAASAAPAHAASSPAITCAAAKRRSSIKRLRAINTCFTNAIRLDLQDPDPACIAKADQASQRQFQRLEKSGTCQPMTGDEPVAEVIMNRCEASLLEGLPGACIESGSPCSNTLPCCNTFCRISTIGGNGVCE